MSDFSAEELTNFRTAQDGHMMDTCLVGVRTVSYNTFGEPVEVFTNSAATDCGLDMRSGSERHGEKMTQITYDATMRLPIGTTVNVLDRITVTHRFSEAVTNITYRVESPVQRGPSGVRVLLRKVDP
jgi:hypothetical protein